MTEHDRPLLGDIVATRRDDCGAQVQPTGGVCEAGDILYLHNDEERAWRRSDRCAKPDARND